MMQHIVVLAGRPDEVQQNLDKLTKSVSEKKGRITATSSGIATSDSRGNQIVVTVLIED